MDSVKLLQNWNYCMWGFSKVIVTSRHTVELRTKENNIAKVLIYLWKLKHLCFNWHKDKNNSAGCDKFFLLLHPLLFLLKLHSICPYSSTVYGIFYTFIFKLKRKKNSEKCWSYLASNLDSYLDCRLLSTVIPFI